MFPVSLVAWLNRLPIWRPRIRVWDFTLIPPTFDRRLYLWMHRAGRMGAEERRFFTQAIRPGMQVADVGANLGLYSLLFSRLVGPEGRVYAFEPDSLMAAALRENLAANAVQHVEVFVCAVGASAGQAVLKRNAINSGDNRLGPLPATVNAGEATVPVKTLSEVLRGRPVDFVKMDVQGWEGEALSGIGGLLDANPRLQIYFEFWPRGLNGAGTSVARLASALRGLGLHIRRPHMVDDVDIEDLARTMKPGAYTNLLAARAS